MQIERPDFDEAHLRARFDFNLKELDELQEELVNNHGYLPGIYDAGLELLARACVLRPDDPVLYRAAQATARSAAAMFTLHRQTLANQSPRARLELPGCEPVLLERAPSSSLGPINWQYGMSCALITRDVDAQVALGVVTADAISASGVQTDRYQYDWISMLKSLHRGESLAGQLAELEAAAAPDRVEIATTRHVRVTLAAARCADAIDRDDGVAFNDQLAELLIAHRAIWQGQNNWRANVCLDALALACVGFDRGFPVAVESGYLPDALIHHEHGDADLIDVNEDE